jgi:hypothetical protein
VFGLAPIRVRVSSPTLPKRLLKRGRCWFCARNSNWCTTSGPKNVPARPRTQINSRRSCTGPCVAGPYRKRRQLAARWKKSLGPACWWRVDDRPVGNPKRKVWWAQQQVFPQYETKIYRTSRRKNQLPKVDARWLGDSSRQFIYGALSRAWWLMCSWWWLWPDSWKTPSGKYDEHSGKSFPSVRNQGLSIRRRADSTTEGDAW